MSKTHSWGTQIENSLLAYRLLESVYLPQLHEQVVRGIVPDLKCDTMKDHLKKLLGESFPSNEKCTVKKEDIFQAQH